MWSVTVKLIISFLRRCLPFCCGCVWCAYQAIRCGGQVFETSTVPPRLFRRIPVMVSSTAQEQQVQPLSVKSKKVAAKQQKHKSPDISKIANPMNQIGYQAVALSNEEIIRDPSLRFVNNVRACASWFEEARFDEIMDAQQWAKVTGVTATTASSNAGHIDIMVARMDRSGVGQGEEDEEEILGRVRLSLLEIPKRKLTVCWLQLSDEAGSPATEVAIENDTDDLDILDLRTKANSVNSPSSVSHPLTPHTHATDRAKRTLDQRTEVGEWVKVGAGARAELRIGIFWYMDRTVGKELIRSKIGQRTDANMPMYMPWYDPRKGALEKPRVSLQNLEHNKDKENETHAEDESSSLSSLSSEDLSEQQGNVQDETLGSVSDEAQDDACSETDSNNDSSSQEDEDFSDENDEHGMEEEEIQMQRQQARLERITRERWQSQQVKFQKDLLVCLKRMKGNGYEVRLHEKPKTDPVVRHLRINSSETGYTLRVCLRSGVANESDPSYLISDLAQVQPGLTSPALASNLPLHRSNLCVVLRFWKPQRESAALNKILARVGRPTDKQTKLPQLPEKNAEPLGGDKSGQQGPSLQLDLKQTSLEKKTNSLSLEFDTFSAYRNFIIGVKLLKAKLVWPTDPALLSMTAEDLDSNTAGNCNRDSTLSTWSDDGDGAGSQATTGDFDY